MAREITVRLYMVGRKWAFRLITRRKRFLPFLGFGRVFGISSSITFLLDKKIRFLLLALMMNRRPSSRFDLTGIESVLCSTESVDQYS